MAFLTSAYRNTARSSTVRTPLANRRALAQVHLHRNYGRQPDITHPLLIAKWLKYLREGCGPTQRGWLQEHRLRSHLPKPNLPPHADHLPPADATAQSDIGLRCEWRSRCYQPLLQ